jgi:hypothetical protein
MVGAVRFTVRRRGRRKVYREEGETCTGYRRCTPDEGRSVDRAVNRRAAAVAASVGCWWWKTGNGTTGEVPVTGPK